METAPFIGVITPCRNRREKTMRFLSAFRKQDYSAFRIYAIDSNSSDGTPDIIRRFYPEVHVIEADDSKFWTGATNLGVRQALADGCDYILTINDDSLVGPEYLRELVAEAVERSIDVLAARIEFLHRPGLLWSLGAYNDWANGNPFQLLHNEQWADECPLMADGPRTFPVEAMCGNGVLIHRRVFGKIGLYDEKWTPHYHADSEFTLRAAKFGFQPHVTTRTVLYNDAFNDAPGSGGTPPPPNAPTWHVSHLQYLLSIAKRVFLPTRSEMYWRALVAVIWRYCPREHLPRCTFYFARKIYRSYFARIVDAFLGIVPPAVKSTKVSVNGLLPRRCERSRALTLRGELSIEILEELDRVPDGQLIDAACRELFCRESNAAERGAAVALLGKPAGRARLLLHLLDSGDAVRSGLRGRTSPLVRRILQDRVNAESGIMPNVSGLVEERLRPATHGMVPADLLANVQQAKSTAVA